MTVDNSLPTPGDTHPPVDSAEVHTTNGDHSHLSDPPQLTLEEPTVEDGPRHLYDSRKYKSVGSTSYAHTGTHPYKHARTKPSAWNPTSPFPHPPSQRRLSAKSSLKAKKYRQLSSAPTTPLYPKDVWIDVADEDTSRSPDTSRHHQSPVNILQPSPIRSQPLALNGVVDSHPYQSGDDHHTDSAISDQNTPTTTKPPLPTQPPASAPPKAPLAHDLTNTNTAAVKSQTQPPPADTALRHRALHTKDPPDNATLRAKASHSALQEPASPSRKKAPFNRRASSGAVFDADQMAKDLEMFRARHKPALAADESQQQQPRRTSAAPPSATSTKPSHPSSARTQNSSALYSNDAKPPSRSPIPPPISASAATSKKTIPVDPPMAPFSLWEYLKEEVLATDFDSTQEMKWERVTNFVVVPYWVESIILFGFVICLDSFLYTFTILPLRFFTAIYLWITSNIHAILHPNAPRRRLHSSHKCDVLKSGLVVCSCYILSKLTDASKMYHSVRGQDVIKLYVIFNVMEILDRLCCSLGQDLLDALFSRMTLGRRKDGSQPLARPIGFFIMALIYIQLHTMVLFYQLVTLNVAINSYDNALLTLLLSNQFVEIKGAVFKKFEKENLFQMTCADIVERFQLALILSAIAIRNLIEVSGGMGGNNGGEVPLPRAFTFLPSISVIETSFAPVAIVLLSECMVDWLKHAFITKFNHIRPAVYGRFMDVLCRDLVVGGPTPPSAAVPNAVPPTPGIPSTATFPPTQPPASAATTAQSPQPPTALGTTTSDAASSQHPIAAATATVSTSAATSAALAAATARSRRRHTFVDQSPIVSRRLGFAALPLACLLVRVSAQIWGMIADNSHYDECATSASASSAAAATPIASSNDSLTLSYSEPLSILTWLIGSGPTQAHQILVSTTVDGAIHFLAWSLTLLLGWAFLVAVKLLLGTFLISFASNRYRTMTAREAEEDLNARDRVPIGVDKGEREYEAKGKQYLERQQQDEGDQVPQQQQQQQQQTTKKSAGSNLMDVGRYTMIKSRLW